MHHFDLDFVTLTSPEVSSQQSFQPNVCKGESCPLTKLNGGLSRLYSADEDAVSWLTSYGSWHAYEKKISNSETLQWTKFKANEKHMYACLARHVSKCTVNTSMKLQQQHLALASYLSLPSTDFSGQSMFDAPLTIRQANYRMITLPTNWHFCRIFWHFYEFFSHWYPHNILCASVQLAPIMVMAVYVMQQLNTSCSTHQKNVTVLSSPKIRLSSTPFSKHPNILALFVKFLTFLF